jgi:PKD repeat protein
MYNVSLSESNSACQNSTLEKEGYISVNAIITGGGKAWYLVHSNVNGAEVYFNHDSFEGVIQNDTLLVQTCPTCTPVFSFTLKKCGYFTLTQPNTNYPADNQTVDLYANLTAPKEPLIADFSGNVTSGQAPLDVMFTSHSIGIVESWNWSFGDGTYSEDAQPVHTYTADGTYTVGLTESNSACQNDTIVKKDFITVGVPKPTFQANFTVSPTSGMAPLTVKCTDTSIGKPTWFSYNFGDGITMSGPNPVHTYRFPGTYSIT